MHTYLVSYDLAKPHVNKHVVAQAIMELGLGWARPLEQTWYIRSEEREEVLEARLAALLADDDGLIIQVVADDAILTNTSLRWFKRRRPAIDDREANVIAFPTQLAALPQAELPFAKAC